MFLGPCVRDDFGRVFLRAAFGLGGSSFRDFPRARLRLGANRFVRAPGKTGGTRCGSARISVRKTFDLDCNSQIAKDDQARYMLLGEHLLIAQTLLESDDVATRKRGFWIVSESANFAAAQLAKDKWILARIYEGFLLPKITLANVTLWQDPSCSRILEASVSAFGKAGERDKQIRVLEWLISIGDKTPQKHEPDALTLELNTLDWARGTLAALLFAPADATRPQLERALQLFQAIQSPDMEGFKHLQAKLQVRLDKMAKL